MEDFTFDMTKTYADGFKDGISAYSEVCAKFPECDGCPIAKEIPINSTCEEFIRNNKDRVASLVAQALEMEHSYFAEYKMRFPHCTLTVEQIADGACRKALFNGDLSCSGGDCVACWKEGYYSDLL